MLHTRGIRMHCGVRVRRVGTFTSRSFTIIFLLLCIATGAAVAGDKLDGKELYRDNCKVCHDKGSPNKHYMPMTLVQEQWQRFFDTKLTPSHKGAEINGHKLLETLKPEQLKAIKKFCVDHAADSEHPATCG